MTKTLLGTPDPEELPEDRLRKVNEGIESAARELQKLVEQLRKSFEEQNKKDQEGTWL